MDALHLINHFVKSAWRKGQVASALFLDVKAAFPSVDVETLLNRMVEVRVPLSYVCWIRARLQDQTTVLSFDGYTLPPFNIKNGLDQGCHQEFFVLPDENVGILRA